MKRQSVVRRRTATFAAAGDDGRTYSVRVYVWFTPVPCPCGRTVTEVEGRRELETAAGLGVSRLGRGRYLIDAIGVVLRSADPAAP